MGIDHGGRVGLEIYVAHLLYSGDSKFTELSECSKHSECSQVLQAFRTLQVCGGVRRPSPCSRMAQALRMLQAFRVLPSLMLVASVLMCCVGVGMGRLDWSLVERIGSGKVDWRREAGLVCQNGLVWTRRTGAGRLDCLWQKDCIGQSGLV